MTEKKDKNQWNYQWIYDIYIIWKLSQHFEHLAMVILNPFLYCINSFHIVNIPAKSFTEEILFLNFRKTWSNLH